MSDLDEQFFADSRRTVTVLVRTPTGERNTYGNAELVDTEVDVPGMLVGWDGSTDDQAAAERTTTTATLYDVSGAWPAEPGSTVNRVRFDDAVWEVAGDPQRWPGSIGGTVIRVRKVSG